MFHTLPEDAVFVQALPPASRNESTNSGVYTSSYFPVGDAAYVTFLVEAGDISSGDTLDFAVLKATDSGGSNPTAVSGATITQLTDADDNKLCAVTVKADTLGFYTNGAPFTHLAGRITIGGSSAAVLCAVTAIRYHLRSAPAAASGLEEDVRVVA